MTSRSYFGKMNSTLGSVVPLAMFLQILEIFFLFLTLQPLEVRSPSEKGLFLNLCYWHVVKENVEY